MRERADLLLEAQANATRRFNLLKKKIILPILLREFRLEWAKMSDAMKEQFKHDRPEDYAVLMKSFEGDANA